MSDSNEISRLLAVKNAIVITTNTPGWRFIQQIAQNLVSKAIEDALDEENREQGEAKRLKASALKKGINDLLNAIENTKNINPESDFENGLGELEYQED
jgi:hypothetical protein